MDQLIDLLTIEIPHSVAYVIWAIGVPLIGILPRIFG